MVAGGGAQSIALPAGPLRHAAEALAADYYPLLVLAFLGAIVWLDNRGDPAIHKKPID